MIKTRRKNPSLKKLLHYYIVCYNREDMLYFYCVHALVCNEFCLIDILSSEKDCVLENVERNLQVKALYRKLGESLTKRESSILIMRYGLIDGKCKTQREIAVNLGISRSYVSRIEKKALKKLKKELFTK